ncbi:MAG: PKD domain-containing protein [Bacteroidota bacterium]
MIKLLLAILFLINTLALFSQTGCTNSDFESGTFQNWTGQTGSCCGVNTPNNGIVNGQHTIMSGAAIDPYSCGNIPVVAPGSTFSARLGNDASNYGAERLRYTFNITPDNTLIIYKYAVVLEDAGHPASDQPRFEAKLLNQNGQTIPCTYYYVAAGPGSGFQNCGGIQYKTWTTIGVDVTPYIGQTVTLDFATGDCGQGAHFGYAYVDASCAPFVIDSRYCEVQNGLNVAVLTAPAGFQSYQWSTGGTGPITTVVNPQQGQVVTCQITSVNGCVANLQAILTPSDATASYIPESVCTGDTVNLVNTSVFENAIQDSVHWTSSDGFTSTTPDFEHVFSSTGAYQVELFIESDAGCVDSVTQTINVYNFPVADISSVDACVGQNTVVTSASTIADNSTLSNIWTINGSTFNGSSTTLPTSSADTISVQLISTSQNNCSDTITESFIVYNNPTAGFSFNEVCDGSPMTFTDSSTLYSSQNDISWQYNNQEVATTADLTYTFPSSGNNSVTLIVQDNYSTVSCSDTMTQSFLVHGIPVISYSGDTTQCEDLPFTFTNNSSNPTGESMTYEWFINNNSVSTSPNLTYTINNSGVYPISLNATSSFGCELDTTFDLYIYPTPLEPILSATTPICPGDPITFSAAGAIPNSTISWSGPNNLVSTDFSFSIPIYEEQMGYYTAFITSEYGCISDTANVFASILHIYGFDDFDFPNVITANNDGTNDEITLFANFKTCEEYTLYIFNRWGNLVFEQTLYSPQFKGETLNGDKLEEGVYFYKLVIMDAAEDKSTKHGYIHVVK